MPDKPTIAHCCTSETYFSAVYGWAYLSVDRGAEVVGIGRVQLVQRNGSKELADNEPTINASENDFDSLSVYQSESAYKEYALMKTPRN